MYSKTLDLHLHTHTHMEQLNYKKFSRPVIPFSPSHYESSDYSQTKMWRWRHLTSLSSLLTMWGFQSCTLSQGRLPGGFSKLEENRPTGTKIQILTVALCPCQTFQTDYIRSHTARDVGHMAFGLECVTGSPTSWVPRYGLSMGHPGWILYQPQSYHKTDT